MCEEQRESISSLRGVAEQREQEAQKARDDAAASVRKMKAEMARRDATEASRKKLEGVAKKAEEKEAQKLKHQRSVSQAKVTELERQLDALRVSNRELQVQPKPMQTYEPGDQGAECCIGGAPVRGFAASCPGKSGAVGAGAREAAAGARATGD